MSRFLRRAANVNVDVGKKWKALRGVISSVRNKPRRKYVSMQDEEELMCFENDTASVQSSSSCSSRNKKQQRRRSSRRSSSGDHDDLFTSVWKDGASTEITAEYNGEDEEVEVIVPQIKQEVCIEFCASAATTPTTKTKDSLIPLEEVSTDSTTEDEEDEECDEEASAAPSEAPSTCTIRSVRFADEVDGGSHQLEFVYRIPSLKDEYRARKKKMKKDVICSFEI